MSADARVPRPANEINPLAKHQRRRLANVLLWSVTSLSISSSASGIYLALNNGYTVGGALLLSGAGGFKWAYGKAASP